MSDEPAKTFDEWFRFRAGGDSPLDGLVAYMETFGARAWIAGQRAQMAETQAQFAELRAAIQKEVVE